MASLFDSLRQRLGQQPADVQASDQLAAQKVLAAKSGKVKGGGIAGSNVAEQTAVSNVNAAVGQGTLAGRIQSNQLANAASQQAQKVDTAQKQLTQNKNLAEQELASKGNLAREDLANREGMATTAREANRTQTLEEVNHKATSQLASLMAEKDIGTANMFADFNRQAKGLEAERNRMAMEERGFLLALSNKQYVNQIEQIGKQRQLTKQTRFREAAAELAFGSDMARLLDKLGFADKMADSRRGWEKELANMGYNDKLALARSALDGENRRMVATGIGDTVGAGLDYAVKREEKAEAAAAKDKDKK